jgi:hypothetical protein
LDIYLSCLIGGGVALVVLAFCGIGFHHIGIRPGVGHTSHAPGGHVRVPARQAGHLSSARTTAANQAVSNLISGVLTWLSPAYLAGAIIGFGATGTLFAPILHGWLQLAVALIGAYVLCFFCIRPLLTGIQKWASLPAKTLTDAMLENGTAVTDFDSKGYGLVRLNLDGQVVQLLGQLAPEEQSGARVRSGETLFVRSVDPGKQRCVVCRTSGSILTKY